MKILLAILLLSIFPFRCFSQIGGRHAYEFLNLTSSPKVASLGGKYISHNDEDLSVAYYNPSLLNEQMDHHLTLNFVNYFAGVKYGYVSFGKNLTPRDNLAIGIQYINYGTFIAAEPTGEITGTFAAAEYAFNFAFSHKLDSFYTIGADIRPILSVYENYQSFGYSTDWGIMYHNPKNLYTLALVIRNLGFQIKPYYQNVHESLPFEIQFGFTQELKYAPFRFSITAQHLETPDMSVHDFAADYNSSDVGTTQKQQKRTIEKISDGVMRHLIFGVEFSPFTNFYLRTGYNYQRRQELKIPANVAMVGFSWGFGITISRFQFNYGRATYHLAGASNHFSIATDLPTFTRRKTSDND